MSQRLHQTVLCFGVFPSDLCFTGISFTGTLSGPIGKVVASHDAVARSIPAEVTLIYNMHYALRGNCPESGGCDKLIGSTVSDATVGSCLWLTATKSSPLGCFSTLLQVVDNWPHILCSRFSTGRLLAIEDFTFTFYWDDRDVLLMLLRLSVLTEEHANYS